MPGVTPEVRHTVSTFWLCALALALTVPAAGVSETFGSLDEAERIYRQTGPQAALPHFESLAEEFRDSGEEESLARTIGFIGEIRWRTGDYEVADDLLRQALALHRSHGSRVLEARTLNVLGLLQWDLGQLDEAQATFREGSVIAEEEGDRRLQGALINNSGLVLDERGSYDASLAQYRQALELYRDESFPRGEGDTLGNMGGVYLILGRYRQALDHYQQALAISEQLASAISLSQDHGNLGLACLGLGRVDQALTHLDAAIEQATASGMQQDQAYWLRHRGNAQVLKGLHDKGLESHRTAIDLYEKIGAGTERVEALHDIGQLHLVLGDTVTARNRFLESMELARSIGLSRAITLNMMALGDLQASHGDLEAAAALYAQAAERARESGELAQWTDALLRLAAAWREQDRLDEAETAARQALDIAVETAAAGRHAQALYALAELARLQDLNPDALKLYREADELLESVPDVELRWRVLHGQGLSEFSTGDPAAAVRSLQEAIGVIEGVRDRLEQERFRAGYLQDKFQVYVDLVRIQLEAGLSEDAFSTAERLRSRSYLDLLEGAEASNSTQAENLDEFELRERILTLRRALATERDLPRMEQRQPAIRVYSQELFEAEQEYQAMLDERRRGRPVHGLDRVPTYADVGARLRSDEALVEYVVGQDNIMLFLLTAQEIYTHVIPLRRQDLDNKVELLRNLVSRQDDERWKKPAGSLSGLLLDPLTASGRLEPVRHLYLVPHGTLNYLPFALLPLNGQDGGRPIIESLTLAYLPTAAALLTAGGDSVQGEGLLAVAPERTRLRYADEEALVINALMETRSKVLIGSEATESAFKLEAAGYRMLHLATHGYFNKLNPMLSGLELESDAANDGQLELHEILNLDLNADLVTLSACQTGLGSGFFNEVPAGDDFVGLTRAFLYAGSTSVMATLWQVDDASTLDLMKLFYGRLQQAGTRADKARALAEAQRGLLASNRYRHPYYWAPFVLVGDSQRGSPEQT